MNGEESRFHTFVVRCWVELSETGGPWEWRGEVRHLPGGESMRFRELESGLEFMRSLLAAQLRSYRPGSPGESGAET